MRAVVGFRQWRVDGDMLLPLFDNYGGTNAMRAPVPWTPGENVAVCRAYKRMHVEMPGTDCGCGLYARYTLDDESRALRRPHVYDRVTGLVSATGALELHRDGFRAERMTILALAAPPLPDADEWHAVTRLVADRYEVPVLALDALDGHARLFGMPVPDVLKPEAPWMGANHGS